MAENTTNANESNNEPKKFNLFNSLVKNSKKVFSGIKQNVKKGFTETPVAAVSASVAFAVATFNFTLPMLIISAAIVGAVVVVRTVNDYSAIHKQHTSSKADNMKIGHNQSPQLDKDPQQMNVDLKNIRDELRQSHKQAITDNQEQITSYNKSDKHINPQSTRKHQKSSLSYYK